MRIVFLDMDGVVVPVGALKDVDVPELVRNPFAHLDLVIAGASVAAVRNVRRLVTDVPAQFVLISTWRKILPPEFTKEVLSRLGLFEHFHEDWEARFRFSSAKAHDIADWLEDHRNFRSEDALVVDDEDLNVRGIHQHRPVSNVGFSDADLQAVLAHFRRAEVAERWMISYRYQVWHAPQSSAENFKMGGAHDLVQLIDKHPTRLVADMAQAYRVFRNLEGDRRGDELLRIYWAMPVPNGMLTEEDLELLS